MTDFHPHKSYLGDGVYAEFDGFAIWLFLSNGIRDSNRICLEPEVLHHLDEYREMLRTLAAEERARAAIEAQDEKRP